MPRLKWYLPPDPLTDEDLATVRMMMKAPQDYGFDSPEEFFEAEAFRRSVGAPMNFDRADCLCCCALDGDEADQMVA